MSESSSDSVTRAIISVSDKSGLTEFAAALVEHGVEIFSTGGTARHLADAGLPVRDIAEYTGFPEMMDGRVKTLHPKIFGGILCRRDLAEDMESTAAHDMVPFDLVVVNLYPFAKTIAREDCDRTMAIENIDIGGPSLVRAAAKNSAWVTIATSPDQYPAIVEELGRDGCTSQDLRDRLMAEAFAHTAAYDRMIAGYFARSEPAANGDSVLPDEMNLKLSRSMNLRYGENSHQAAALYALNSDTGASLATARQLHGKALSFNNLLDINSGMTMASSFAEPACIVIKHNNPCGAATGNDLANVFQRAFAGDPVSAFGSIVATNREVDETTADFLATGNFFVESIVAPGFSTSAVEILTIKPKWKKNVRLVVCDLVDADSPRLDMRRVHGGFLIQQADDLLVESSNWRNATELEISDELIGELAFAWNMVRFVKSNAIVLGQQRALCGVGAGQMSRVDAVRIAINKAGDRARGSVLASDAFFPFPDSIEIAAEAGIAAVIQPGGSVKDDEVVAVASEHGIPMLITGRRHFLH
ncbi:MAG: bifunctional phosphoribosylaminoimidazolecarboxamide formyltransferase/IMP cyclohydrolase [Pirellulaceae bacterium]